MASIRTNDGPDGMRNDFEQSAAHLLPYDLVAKKHAAGSSKRGSTEVLAVSYEATDVAAFGTKPGIGKSGVHFCYYDKSEYSKLTKEQKTELGEWPSKGGAERGRGDAKAKFDKAVAAAIEKKISEQAKASEEERMAGVKLRSLITSIIKETREMTTPGRRATTIGATTATAVSKSSNPTTQNWGRLMSKTELCEWRSKGGAEWGRSDTRTKKAKFEKAVAAAVEKKISEQAKVSEEEKMAGDKLRSLIASIIKETGGTTTSDRRATTIGATTATGKSSNPTTQKWED